MSDDSTTLRRSTRSTSRRLSTTAETSPLSELSSTPSKKQLTTKKSALSSIEEVSGNVQEDSHLLEKVDTPTKTTRVPRRRSVLSSIQETNSPAIEKSQTISEDNGETEKLSRPLLRTRRSSFTAVESPRPTRRTSRRSVANGDADALIETSTPVRRSRRLSMDSNLDEDVPAVPITKRRGRPTVESIAENVELESENTMNNKIIDESTADKTNKSVIEEITDDSEGSFSVKHITRTANSPKFGQSPLDVLKHETNSTKQNFGSNGSKNSPKVTAGPPVVVLSDINKLNINSMKQKLSTSISEIQTKIATHTNEIDKTAEAEVKNVDDLSNDSINLHLSTSEHSTPEHSPNKCNKSSTIQVTETIENRDDEVYDKITISQCVEVPNKCTGDDFEPDVIMTNVSTESVSTEVERSKILPENIQSVNSSITQSSEIINEDQNISKCDETERDLNIITSPIKYVNDTKNQVNEPVNISNLCNGNELNLKLVTELKKEEEVFLNSASDSNGSSFNNSIDTTKSIDIIKDVEVFIEDKVKDKTIKNFEKDDVTVMNSFSIQEHNSSTSSNISCEKASSDSNKSSLQDSSNAAFDRDEENLMNNTSFPANSSLIDSEDQEASRDANKLAIIINEIELEETNKNKSFKNLAKYDDISMKTDSIQSHTSLNSSTDLCEMTSPDANTSTSCLKYEKNSSEELVKHEMLVENNIFVLPDSSNNSGDLYKDISLDANNSNSFVEDDVLISKESVQDKSFEDDILMNSDSSQTHTSFNNSVDLCKITSPDVNKSTTSPKHVKNIVEEPVKNFTCERDQEELINNTSVEEDPLINRSKSENVSKSTSLDANNTISFIKHIENNTEPSVKDKIFDTDEDNLMKNTFVREDSLINSSIDLSKQDCSDSTQSTSFAEDIKVISEEIIIKTFESSEGTQKGEPISNNDGSSQDEDNIVIDKMEEGTIATNNDNEKIEVVQNNDLNEPQELEHENNKELLERSTTSNVAADVKSNIENVTPTILDDFNTEHNDGDDGDNGDNVDSSELLSSDDDEVESPRTVKMIHISTDSDSSDNFLDNEAIDAGEGYESNDSMSSNELNEIADNNAFLEKGEVLHSSDESQLTDDEYHNDSFCVEDDSEGSLLEGSGDDLELISTPPKKNFKSILKGVKNNQYESDRNVSLRSTRNFIISSDEDETVPPNYEVTNNSNSGKKLKKNNDAITKCLSAKDTNISQSECVKISQNDSMIDKHLGVLKQITHNDSESVNTSKKGNNSINHEFDVSKQSNRNGIISSDEDDISLPNSTEEPDITEINFEKVLENLNNTKSFIKETVDSVEPAFATSDNSNQVLENENIDETNNRILSNFEDNKMQLSGSDNLSENVKRNDSVSMIIANKSQEETFVKTIDNQNTNNDTKIRESILRKKDDSNKVVDSKKSSIVNLLVDQGKNSSPDNKGKNETNELIQNSKFGKRVALKRKMDESNFNKPLQKSSHQRDNVPSKPSKIGKTSSTLSEPMATTSFAVSPVIKTRNNKRKRLLKKQTATTTSAWTDNTEFQVKRIKKEEKINVSKDGGTTNFIVSIEQKPKVLSNFKVNALADSRANRTQTLSLPKLKHKQSSRGKRL